MSFATQLHREKCEKGVCNARTFKYASCVIVETTHRVYQSRNTTVSLRKHGKEFLTFSMEFPHAREAVTSPQRNQFRLPALIACKLVGQL